MPRFLFKVEDSSAITGRGVVVVPGTLADDRDARVQVGDSIELRRPDGKRMRTIVRGIELGGLGASIPILLGQDVTKIDMPTGTEVWSVREWSCDSLTHQGIRADSQ